MDQQQIIQPRDDLLQESASVLLLVLPASFFRSSGSFRAGDLAGARVSRALPGPPLRHSMTQRGHEASQASPLRHTAPKKLFILQQKHT